MPIGSIQLKMPKRTSTLGDGIITSTGLTVLSRVLHPGNLHESPIAELCRQHGISEQSYYRWKKIYGGMEPSEARELKGLREENIKLKRLVAGLSLDKVMLQDVLQKKF
jgi:putative transposase